MNFPLLMTSRRNNSKSVLPEASEKAEFVRKNFNEIAPHYDLFNDIITFGMHRRWKKLTAIAVLPRDERPVAILDLCCGTGDLSLRLSHLLAHGSTLGCLDFSEEMLGIIHRRFARAENRNRKSRFELNIMQGDAQNLINVPDDSQDGVMIGFGLRNVVDRKRCLQEIKRVLRAGGRLAVLDVGRVQPAFLRPLYRLHFEWITPWVGYILQGGRHEMFAYLPASAQTYPDQETLKEELDRVGFSPIQYRNFMFGAAVLHLAIKP